MGASNAESNRPIITTVEPETRGTTDSKSTGSTNAGTTGGTGGTGNTGGTGGTGEKEKDVSKLADVKTDEQKKEERNQKRRERYAKQKIENGGSVKPRKVNKKKQVTPTIDTSQLNMMLASVSAIVASRPNCEHWLLSEQEIDSITKPLAKMLEETTALETLGQYSNQLALGVACITIFAPRLIITVKQKQEEKKKIERVKKSPGNEKQDKKLSGGNEPKPTTTGKNDIDNLSFYGSPIH